MIIRAVFIFIVLLAAILVGLQLHQDSGYILITIHHWTIETTFWVGLGLFIISCILFYLLVTFLLAMLRFPHHWKGWLAKQRALKSQAKTRQGLIEFSEGHWQKAKNHLVQAIPAAETPLLNYLTAARAAQEMGDAHLRDEYLRKAQQSIPDAKVAVSITQAELQIADQQWEQALATLQFLQEIAPHNPQVLKLLIQLYQETNDWKALIALFPEIKKAKILRSEAFESLEEQTYLSYFTSLIRANSKVCLTSLWNKLPYEMMVNSEIVALYCRYLIEQHELQQAETILRKRLKEQFHEPLVQLYGEIAANEDQLQFMETLLKKHPHSSMLFLVLGKISKKLNLWGKAKNYLEQSVALHKNTEAYLELGELFEYLNEPSKACLAYKEGLQTNH